MAGLYRAALAVVVAQVLARVYRFYTLFIVTVLAVVVVGLMAQQELAL